MLEVYWSGVFIVGILGGILGLAATVVGAVMALDPVFGGEDATKGARMALAALPTAVAFAFGWPLLIPAALVALFWGMGDHDPETCGCRNPYRQEVGQ